MKSGRGRSRGRQLHFYFRFFRTGSHVRYLARFIRDESGQGTLEYVLILTFTIVAASALFKKLISLMDDGFKVFAAQLEKDLKSGRKPLSVWKN